MPQPRRMEGRWNWRRITGSLPITGSMPCTFQRRSATTGCSTLSGIGGLGSLQGASGPTGIAIRIGGLRIGYVSADFARHPVGWFMAPVLPNHDPAQVEVICYSDREVEDDLTRFLRNHCQSWISTSGMDDRALAERIRADGIDLLIDLGGHTARNRLGTFALAPAPVQATWGGLIGTTGLPAMDWLIGDSRQVPESAEQLLHRAYHPAASRLCLLRTAGLRAGRHAIAGSAKTVIVTFGCFNRLAKLSDETLALWARVLDAVPQSRLLLNTKELACQGLRERVIGRFAGVGIDRDRLDLRPGGSHVEMLAAYGEVDVALDPMPYSGGLTTLEALWMGVPVVTLPGRRFCARHSLSHVTVLGHPEWAAEDADEYVRIAAGFAADIGIAGDASGWHEGTDGRFSPVRRSGVHPRA